MKRTKKRRTVRKSENKQKNMAKKKMTMTKSKMTILLVILDSKAL